MTNTKKLQTFLRESDVEKVKNLNSGVDTQELQKALTAKAESAPVDITEAKRKVELGLAGLYRITGVLETQAAEKQAEALTKAERFAPQTQQVQQTKVSVPS